MSAQAVGDLAGVDLVVLPSRRIADFTATWITSLLSSSARDSEAGNFVTPDASR